MKRYYALNILYQYLIKPCLLELMTKDMKIKRIGLLVHESPPSLLLL